MKTLGRILVCTVLASATAACGDSGSDDAATSTSSGGADGLVVDFTGPLTADMTLSAANTYLMKGIVFVEAGVTLTIEAGTTIMGEKASLGTLVIEPGAKLIANGTKDEPIVFTSQAEPGERAAGDWGGVVLLGKAPINVPGGVANVEGITGDGTQYGGSSAGDSSGSLQYVRIEFSGTQLSPDNEVNGLTLAGVGSGTLIDHVMVHHTLDDCFEFFGGTVNAKHLICAYNGDDGFDWDNGFAGKLQFLALQQDPSVADDTNGFEGDNDADGSTNAPLSEPTIYNATLCGKNVDVDKQQYGMLLRRSTMAHLHNLVVTGFEAGVDIRDADTTIELTSSIFYGNLAQNVAYAELGTEGIDKDDDGGLDEVAWFNAAGSSNSERDPMIRDCFNPTAPDFRPMTTITDAAKAPPSDGFFDASAAYIGAFTAEENWAEGAWVSFAQN